MCFERDAFLQRIAWMKLNQITSQCTNISDDKSLYIDVCCLKVHYWGGMMDNEVENKMCFGFF